MNPYILAVCLDASLRVCLRAADAMPIPSVSSWVVIFLIGSIGLLCSGGTGRGGHGQA